MVNLGSSTLKHWLAALAGFAFAAASTPAQDEAEFRSALILGSAENQSLSQQLIVDLEKKLWIAYQEKAQDQYEKAVERLNLQYGVAVERQLAKSESTSLQLAVRNEVKLLAAGQSPITPDGKPKPSPIAEIRKLRQMYSDHTAS